MKVQTRYRSMIPAALAIFSLALLGFVGTAAAAAGGNGNGNGTATSAEHANANANKTTAAPDGAPAADSSASAPTTDTTGPGGQVCDGDPNNAPGAGGNYENTCPAGPSLNGNNDDGNSNKPCAGCVGNADDKNPPGQADSGPTDHNNGYECDQKGAGANQGNNGVGFGNPAHTGCQNTVVPPQTCPDGSPMPASGDCSPPQTCPDGSPMPANGNCHPDTPKPPCTPSEVCDTVTPSCVSSSTRCGGVEAASVEPAVQVLGVEISRELPAVQAADVAPATLPRTGADTIALLRLATLLAGAGAGLVLAARLRRHEDMVDIASRLGD